METSSVPDQQANHLLDDQLVQKSSDSLPTSVSRREQHASVQEEEQQDAATTIATCIRDEQAIADWLDEQILDYRARLDNNKSLSGGDEEKDESTLRRLMQETTRLRQEHLFLSQLALARAAVATSLPDAIHQGGSDDKEQEEEHTEVADLLFLRQQAVSARDEQVRQALEAKRVLEELRQQVRQAANQCELLQAEKEQLEQSLLQKKKNKNSEQSLVAQNNPSPGGGDNRRRQLQEENTVLKRILVDLVAGSELDWYQDERLVNIMTQFDE